MSQSRWKDQTILHDPDKKQYGNCMQACVASLLDLPMEEVPHFHHDGCDAPTFWERVEEFFLSKGYVMSYGNMYDCINISSGPSKRGTTHCVLTQQDKLLHDPHPSRNGLIEVTHNYHVVPIDPSKK